MKPSESKIAELGSKSLESAPRGQLPSRLNLLYVTGPKSPHNWLRKALITEHECDVQLIETASFGNALERLRTEAFDAILVDHEADVPSCDACVAAVRTGSHAHQAIIVLGDEPASRVAMPWYEAGADAYIAVQLTTPRELIWQIARAAERAQLASENHQLRQRQQRQKSLEQDEVLKLISEQEAILGRDSTWDGRPPMMPEWLGPQLRELLQAYVVMGSGNSMPELGRFIERVQQTPLPRFAVTRAFTAVLRSVMEELGTRSSRHVYNRGNLLLCELLLALDNTPVVPSSSEKMSAPSETAA